MKTMVIWFLITVKYSLLTLMIAMFFVVVVIITIIILQKFMSSRLISSWQLHETVAFIISSKK